MTEITRFGYAQDIRHTRDSWGRHLVHFTLKLEDGLDGLEYLMVNMKSAVDNLHIPTTLLKVYGKMKNDNLEAEKIDYVSKEELEKFKEENRGNK